MKKRYKSGNNAVVIGISCLILALCGGFFAYEKEYAYSGVLLLAAAILLICGCVLGKIYKKSFGEYLNLVTAKSAGMSSDAISKFPLPMAVLQINGQISWYNDLFAEMLGTNDIFDIVISDVMLELKW